MRIVNIINHQKTQSRPNFKGVNIIPQGQRVALAICAVRPEEDVVVQLVERTGFFSKPNYVLLGQSPISQALVTMVRESGERITRNGPKLLEARRQLCNLMNDVIPRLIQREENPHLLRSLGTVAYQGEARFINNVDYVTAQEYLGREAKPGETILAFTPYLKPAESVRNLVTLGAGESKRSLWPTTRTPELVLLDN